MENNNSIEAFVLNNSINFLEITGTFIIIIIGIIAFLSFKLGKKQTLDSYNTNRVQCNQYTNEMEKKKMLYQFLEITYCNGKPLNTNCPYWKLKNRCELQTKIKCKFLFKIYR